MAFNKNGNILVVDDMLTMRKIVKKQLGDWGCTNIQEADDGATAWPILLQALANNQRIDFVISDWNMPKVTGMELLKQVKSHPELKDTPFLMVTAEAEQKNVIEAVKAGVSNYIIKPFAPATLIEKIEKIFEKA